MKILLTKKMTARYFPIYPITRGMGRLTDCSASVEQLCMDAVSERNQDASVVTRLHQ